MSAGRNLFLVFSWAIFCFHFLTYKVQDNFLQRCISIFQLAQSTILYENIGPLKDSDCEEIKGKKIFFQEKQSLRKQFNYSNPPFKFDFLPSLMVFGHCVSWKLPSLCPPAKQPWGWPPELRFGWAAVPRPSAGRSVSTSWNCVGKPEGKWGHLLHLLLLQSHLISKPFIFQFSFKHSPFFWRAI